MNGTLLAVGVVAGLRHAVEADHVAAVSAFATRAARPSDAVRMAMQWAMGHGIVLVAVAALAAYLGAIIEPAGGLAELPVAASLLYLGRGALRRRARAAPAAHRHEPMRPWAVGGLHGVAGSGVLVVGLAVGLGFAGMVWYVLAIAIGALAGMMALGLAIGLGTARAPSWAPGAARLADVLCVVTAVELSVALLAR